MSFCSRTARFLQRVWVLETVVESGTGVVQLTPPSIPGPTNTFLEQIRPIFDIFRHSLTYSRPRTLYFVGVNSFCLLPFPNLLTVMLQVLLLPQIRSKTFSRLSLGVERDIDRATFNSRFYVD